MNMLFWTTYRTKIQLKITQNEMSTVLHNIYYLNFPQILSSLAILGCCFRILSFYVSEYGFSLPVQNIYFS